DALVHSTAGLTVLEATVRGCPIVSYGWGRGHIRVNDHAFRRFGLAEVAANPAELRAILARILAAPRPPQQSLGNATEAAAPVPPAGRGRCRGRCPRRTRTAATGSQPRRP